MTQREYRAYTHMWTKDRNSFDRWMKASAVVGSLFAAAVLIMAIGSAKAPSLDQAAAGRTPGTEVSASARHGSEGAMSPYELTRQFAPDQLPLQQVHEPF
jgi:hypothetical protein